MPLGRLVLKLTVGLALAFAVALTLLRAETLVVGAARDDAYDFIAPPAGCPMPCWQGIRPGITLAAEAIRLLQESDFRGTISSERLNRSRSGLIRFITPAGMADISVQQDLVRSIALTTAITFADIWFLYGRPDQGYWVITRDSTFGTRRLQIQQFAYYQAEDLYVFSTLECPVRLHRLWNARVIVRLGSPIYGAAEGMVLRSANYTEFDLTGLMAGQRACREGSL